MSKQPPNYRTALSYASGQSNRLPGESKGRCAKRFMSCLRKVPYATESEVPQNPGMETYKCKYCDCYHTAQKKKTPMIPKDPKTTIVKAAKSWHYWTNRHNADQQALREAWDKMDIHSPEYGLLIDAEFESSVERYKAEQALFQAVEAAKKPQESKHEAAM